MAAAACTVTTTETGPAPGPAAAVEQPPTEEALPGDQTQPPSDKPAVPEPAKDIAQVTLSGQLATVDVTYGRVGQYIALDMKGDASGLASSDKSVPASKITLAKSTTYELLFPQQGACDAPPELTIDKGAVHLLLQRAGKPSGTISGCHFLAQYVKASDGGFQARLKDVPMQGGGKIKDLAIDLKGPSL
jgi:hypothetical protein